jgi:hypothetical protein
MSTQIVFAVLVSVRAQNCYDTRSQRTDLRCINRGDARPERRPYVGGSIRSVYCSVRVVTTHSTSAFQGKVRRCTRCRSDRHRSARRWIGERELAGRDLVWSQSGLACVWWPAETTGLGARAQRFQWCQQLDVGRHNNLTFLHAPPHARSSALAHAPPPSSVFYRSRTHARARCTLDRSARLHCTRALPHLGSVHCLRTLDTPRHAPHGWRLNSAQPRHSRASPTRAARRTRAPLPSDCTPQNPVLHSHTGAQLASARAHATLARDRDRSTPPPPPPHARTKTRALSLLALQLLAHALSPLSRSPLHQRLARTLSSFTPVAQTCLRVVSDDRRFACVRSCHLRVDCRARD